MEDKSLYISIDWGEYKVNKSNVLKSQVDILSIMKHQENLMKAGQKKSQLKNKLHKLFSNLSQNLENLEKKMPAPKFPKLPKTKDSPRQPTIKQKELSDKHYAIEQELAEIQEKLKQLNS